MAIEMREGLALSDESITRLLPEVCRKFNLQEALLLSTCNRLEMVGVLTRDISHSDELKHVLASVHETFANILHTNKLADVVYSYLDLDAVRHIFSVVASLDSLIVGETQITGQFKKALELAQGCKTVGPLLRRLSQDALANAKKIRAQTDIGRKPVSISHAAVDLTKRVFSNVSDCSFLIIGAGDMGALAARYALSYKPKQLFVANRTKLKAERLVDQLGFGHASDLGNIE
jgi:glutamyl-tRNA reductase